MNFQQRLADLITALGSDAKKFNNTPRFRSMVSGRYYGLNSGVGTGTLAMVTNRLYFIPLWLPLDQIISSIGLEVTTAGAAGTVIRLGAYSSDANDQPSSLIFQTATQAGDTVGIREVVTSQTLPNGVAWLAAVAQGGTPTVRSNGAGIAVPVASTDFATASLNSYTSYYQSAVSGALPATATITPSTLLSAPSPRVLVKAS